MDQSSRSNFDGDERNIIMAVLTQVKILFSFSTACLKRVSKQMVSSTTTVLCKCSSHQIMSGLRSVQGRWYVCDARSTIMFCDTFKLTVIWKKFLLELHYVFDCTFDDCVEQHYSYLVYGVMSVFDIHTTGRMNLVSSSRDGGWSYGEDCHGQHLDHIYDLMASVHIAIGSLVSVVMVVRKRPWTGRARSSDLHLLESL